MDILLFEDNLVGQLAPITIGRPAMAVSCGSYRLIDLVGRLGLPVRAMVRPHLREVLEADTPGMSVEIPPPGPALWVNARLVPRVGLLDSLEALVERRRPGIVYQGGSVAAAVVGPESFASISSPDESETHDESGPPDGQSEIDLADYFSGLKLEPIDAELPLFEYPHDMVRHHPDALAASLEDRLARGDYRELADGLFAAPGAQLGEYVVIDSHEGPILLEENVVIGPYCFLSGPAHIGTGARVIEHAAIKDGVALGHTTKVGGEVEASTIEPYTNKQHHGFLGHSYVGSWVNLGAGTCNSDLKNTYGHVTMEYQNDRVSTRMQFMGCIIGDYAKTAINTSIFTGKTIGACSMVYGFVTTNVPSFVNYARSFGQVTEVPVEVEIATQARMFQRRRVPQRACDARLLHSMHDLTRHERQLASDPLSL